MLEDVNQSPRRIVVGYDASPESESALAWAVGTARPGCDCVEVVIVASAMDPVLSEYHDISEERAGQWRSRARATLRSLGVTDAKVRILHGPAYPELLRAVRSEDLLVVGSTGHPLLAGLLTSSVSQHLVRRASCPVVVVRPTLNSAARRILVGVDGSPASRTALRWACARAAASGDDVLALAACPVGRGRPKNLSERQQTRLDLTAMRLLRELGPIHQAFPEVRITQQAVAGPADRLLVEASAQASLLVVGSRGRDPLIDLVSGSTTQYALRYAHCPVVVVRAPAPVTATTLSRSREP